MTKESVTERYTTQKGEITGYVGVFQPSKQYDNYNIQLLISKSEGEKLVDKLKEIRQKQYKEYGKGTKLAEITQCIPYEVWEEGADEPTPDIAGRYILKTSLKAKSENGVPKYKIQVLDAKTKPVKEAKIGAGTIARLGLNLVGYTFGGKTGVSVKPLCVQIIDLVEYETDISKAYGFEEEENGFEYIEEAQDEDETAEEDF